MAPGGPVDPITLEIMKGAFKAITDEMGIALQKASYSPNIKTRMDHTCSLFDGTRQLLAQTAHQIGHLGAMPFIIKSVLKEHPPETWRPGDGVLVNDPYRGGTHIPDIILVSPVFHGGRLWGFVASLAHHSDVGGMAPGSMAGTAHEIFQEGLRIPSIHLLREGKVQEEMLKFILANVRTPEERKGDLAAQIAANNLGIRRLQELLGRHGPERLQEIATEILDYTERRMRSAIGQIPDGVFRGEDFMDDSGNSDRPIRLAATLTKRGEDLIIDFTGTDPQVHGPTNASFYMTLSLVMYTLRCLTDPDIPQNEGCYRPVKLIIPQGACLNCTFPTAVAAGWEIARRTIDVLCRALLPAIPHKVPAGSNGAMNQVSFGGMNPGTGEPFAYYETHGGGFGARRTKDGMDGVHSVSNTLNTPVEELELFYPLTVERYLLREDSEGAGRLRGGLGLIRELTFHTDVTLSIIADRGKFRPWGIEGGLDAEPQRYAVVGPEGERRLGTKVMTRLKAGETLRIWTAGGGGFGPAGERERALVERDVADGKVSPQRARTIYKW